MEKETRKQIDSNQEFITTDEDISKHGYLRNGKFQGKQRWIKKTASDIRRVGYNKSREGRTVYIEKLNQLYWKRKENREKI